MKQGMILEHTETIRLQLAKQFANDPKGELDCWVSTAQQREAMVVEIYKAVNLDARVPDQGETEAETATVKTVRSLIASIWAQETSHAALIGALRQIDDPSPVQLAGLQGTVEGLITSWATADGLLGTIARALGGGARVFNAAPPFTAGLSTMPLGDFFRFSEELEETASNGYRRIIELLELLEKAGKDSGYGELTHYEFATTLAEENFHQATFKRLRGWLKQGDEKLEGIARDKAKAAIQNLMAEHLGARNVRGLRQSEKTKFLEAADDVLISDAGLGALFKELDIPFRVAARPEA